MGDDYPGFFTETDILGMMEGNDCENIDHVSLRFVEIVDVCCGNSKTAPVTDVFTQYADLVRAFKKGNSQKGWMKREGCWNCSGI